MTEVREFDTRVLLSVVTGKLFVPAWELYDFLDFMAGCEVWPGDVEDLIGLVADEVCCQHSVFRRAVLEDAFGFDDVTVWAEGWADRFGWCFGVSPIVGGFAPDHRLETIAADARFL